MNSRVSSLGLQLLSYDHTQIRRHVHNFTVGKSWSSLAWILGLCHGCHQLKITTETTQLVATGRVSQGCVGGRGSRRDK